MRSKHLLYPFFSIVVFLFGTLIGQAQTEKIIDLAVHDAGNAGNATDLKIMFATEAVDIKHQILVVPDEEEFTLESALASASSQIIYPETASVTHTLATRNMDVHGEAIAEDVTYQVYILVDGSDLSQPSETITLRNEITVTTLVPELNIAVGAMDTDSDGNIYVSDMGEALVSDGSTVYRITPDGETSTYFSTFGLDGADGSDFDSDGNFYQSSSANDRVFKVSPDGEITIHADEGLSSPIGVAVDEDDTVYVTDCSGDAIQQIAPDGTVTVIAESELLDCPWGITLDSENNLYAANYRNNDVLKVTSDGDVELFAQIPGANNTHILYHEGLLYVASRTGHQISTVTLDGEVTVLAGSGERGNDDGPALEATFNLPNDMSFSPDGQILYVNEVDYETTKNDSPTVVRAIIFPRAE